MKSPVPVHPGIHDKPLVKGLMPMGSELGFGCGVDDVLSRLLSLSEHVALDQRHDFYRDTATPEDVDALVGDVA